MKNLCLSDMRQKKRATRNIRRTRRRGSALCPLKSKARGKILSRLCPGKGQTHIRNGEVNFLVCVN